MPRLKKYGKDNFVTVLLKECFSQEELDTQEIYFINLYNAVNDPNFYNLIQGGHGAGEQSRKAMSDKKLGKTNTTKDSVWVELNGSHKRVPKDKLESYLSQGYTLGGCPRGTLAKQRYSSSKQNLVIMTNDKVTVYVQPDQVQKYLDDGYRKGRIKQTECSPAKGRIWIHKDNVSKMIFKDDLDSYLSEGYELGKAKCKSYKKRQSSPTKGKKLIILVDGTRKYI